MKEIISKSPKETIKIAQKFAKRLKKGDVVALIGELGSGKTTFAKGIAKSIGVKKPSYVNSPSFVIIKEYKGKLPLYHFDIFRLNKARYIEDLGYEEYFHGKGVCIIEWADKIKKLLPKKYIEVNFKIKGIDRRQIKISQKSKVKSQK